MLRGEAEEAPKPSSSAPRASCPARRPRHRVPDAGVEVEHDLLEDLLLAREVEVEGALADSAASVIFTIDASW